MTTWQLVVIAFLSGMAGAWVAQVLMAIAQARRVVAGNERKGKAAAAGSLAGKSYDEIFKP